VLEPEDVEDLVAEDTEETQQGQAGQVTAGRAHAFPAGGQQEQQRRRERHPGPRHGERVEVGEDSLANDVERPERQLHEYQPGVDPPVANPHGPPRPAMPAAAIVVVRSSHGATVVV